MLLYVKNKNYSIWRVCLLAHGCRNMQWSNPCVEAADFLFGPVQRWVNLGAGEACMEQLLPTAVIHALPGTVLFNSLHNYPSGPAGRALPAHRETGKQFLLCPATAWHLHLCLLGLGSPFTPQSPAVPPILSHSRETLELFAGDSVAEVQMSSLCHPKICFANTWSWEKWRWVTLVLMEIWVAQALC